MNPATRSFLRAAAEGDANLIRALLAQGTDVNSKNAAGQTALMLASAFGHTPVVKVLIAAGAERDVQDDLGFTALDWSINYTSVGELIAAPLVDTAAPVETSASPVAAAEPPQPATEQPAISPQRAEKVEQNRRGLGGLAGAILRDKAIMVTNDSPPTEVVKASTAEEFRADPLAASPAPTLNPSKQIIFSEPEPVPDPTPVPQEIIAPLERRPDTVERPAEELPSIPSIFKPRRRILSPLPEDDIPDLPPTYESKVDAAPTTTDDDTISGRTETDDTAAPGTRSLSTARILEVDEKDRQRQVPKKVRVDVPSFESIHHSTPRPILWLLIILFVGIGAFGGYKLSNYVFERQSSQTPKETNSPQSQPLAAPIKLGPVVGGKLAGTELLIPDAAYPPSGKIPYGSVTVSVRVDQRGRVTSAQATEGDKTLQGAAEEAARRAAFSPEKLQDKGRSVLGTITYNFLAPSAEPENTQPAPSSADPATTATIPAETSSAPKVGGPLAGTELKIPTPEYPEDVRRDGIKGTVTLVVRVNYDGKVISWRTLEGEQRLRAPAIRAARQATFSPEKLNGGDVVGTITYTFPP
ncbi:MAG TPA: TonB family protein [Pyrinomonadaceae bacterium]|nr:TonB family protein [Pyrinomonadaceae bacterium]